MRAPLGQIEVLDDLIQIEVAVLADRLVGLFVLKFFRFGLLAHAGLETAGLGGRELKTDPVTTAMSMLRFVKRRSLYAPHRQWISWLISKIGSSMANTIAMTNSPMRTISTGPSSPTIAASRPSSSRSWLMAARSSMLSSSPLDSPLEIRWIVMGGNSRLMASERPMGAPSRTRAAAWLTASRIGRLVTTS